MRNVHAGPNFYIHDINTWQIRMDSAIVRSFACLQTEVQAPRFLDYIVVKFGAAIYAYAIEHRKSNFFYKQVCWDEEKPYCQISWPKNVSNWASLFWLNMPSKPWHQSTA